MNRGYAPSPAPPGIVAARARLDDAPAATEPVLKISFPEGWSAGQMADRAAEVRQIAIRKRGVTPRAERLELLPPRRGCEGSRCVQAVPEAAQRRGLSLPVDVLLRAVVERGEPRREADRDVPAALGVDRPSRREGAQADAVRRPDHRVTDREGDRRAQRARPRCRGDLQPARAGHAARRSTPPCATASASRARGPSSSRTSRSNTPLQHAPLQGPAADADHESRRCRRCVRPRSPPRSTTSTTFGSRTACAISSRPMRPSSARRPWSTATRLLALRCGAELREDVGHLEAGADGFGALVQPVVRLLRLLEREQAEGDRNAGLERRKLKP